MKKETSLDSRQEKPPTSAPITLLAFSILFPSRRNTHTPHTIFQTIFDTFNNIHQTVFTHFTIQKVDIFYIPIPFYHTPLSLSLSLSLSLLYRGKTNSFDPSFVIRGSLVKNWNLLNKSSPIFVWNSGRSFVMGAVDNPTDNKLHRLPGEAKRILQSLASSWEDVVDTDSLQVIQLKGAMTNEVYEIKWPSTREHSRKVLARIYGGGVEVFFDREDEIRTFEFISKYGQGPRLLGRFSNGRIEEFIHARTLSACDLHDPEISALIASKMKEFHDLDMPGSKDVLLWDRLRNWLSAAKTMSPPEEAEAFRLDALDEEIKMLETTLTSDNQRFGFCHNDLQYGNIMIDEETRSITIIDYEYAGYNPIAYDIANHFCEMTADYHTETPHIADYSKYPGLEERQRFLRMYLSSSGDQPNDLEIEQLLQDVDKYTLGSHLLWGLWGIISEHVNEIDFNYMEYARQRFQQYWLKKPELLGSSGAIPDGVADGRQEGIGQS